MNEYKNRRQLLCLAVTAGMMFTAVNVSSKTVWAAAEQVIEYDPNQEEKTHPGSIILKQNLKEEDLPSLKQPEASYTDENGIHYRLADWEVRELPEASRSRMLEKTEVYREVEGAETLPPYVDSRQEENGTRISGRLYMQERRQGERGCCVITRLYTEDRFRLWSRFPMRCPLYMNLRNWGIFLIQKKSRKRHWF